MKIPKIALGSVDGETVLLVEDVYPLYSWTDDTPAEDIKPLACIDPEDDETVRPLAGEGSILIMRDRLREIANPTPPLPEEPPIRSFWRDRYAKVNGTEWVMTEAGMLVVSGLGTRNPIPWPEWCVRFGPGKVIS